MSAAVRFLPRELPPRWVIFWTYQKSPGAEIVVRWHSAWRWRWVASLLAGVLLYFSNPGHLPHVMQQHAVSGLLSEQGRR